MNKRIMKRRLISALLGLILLLTNIMPLRAESPITSASADTSVEQVIPSVTETSSSIIEATLPTATIEVPGEMEGNPTVDAADATVEGSSTSDETSPSGETAVTEPTPTEGTAPVVPAEEPDETSTEVTIPVVPNEVPAVTSINTEEATSSTSSEASLVEEQGLTPEQESLVGVPLSKANFTMMRMLIAEGALPDLYAIEINYYKEGTTEAVAPSYLAIVESGKAMTVTSPYVVGYITETKTVDVPATDNLTTAVYYTSPTWSYTVTHQQAQLDGTFATVETETLSGVEGNATQAAPKEYVGFIPYPIEQGIIPANNDLNVDVRYWRITYTITFDTGEDGSPVNSVSNLYGTPLDASMLPAAPTRPGYDFAGWDWNGSEAGLGTMPATMPASSVRATATWTPRPDTSFKVLYWVQNPNNDYYTPIAMHTGGKGTSGEIAPADYLAATGTFAYSTATGPSGSGTPAYSFNDLQTYFHTKSIGQVPVEGDGSTIVNVYYDRNTYTLNMRTHVFRRPSGTSNYFETSTIHTYLSQELRYEQNLKGIFIEVPTLDDHIGTHPSYSTSWFTTPYYTYANGKPYLISNNGTVYNLFDYWQNYHGDNLMTPEKTLHKGIINLATNSADFMANWKGVEGYRRGALYFYENLDSTDSSNWNNYTLVESDLLRGEWTEAPHPVREGVTPVIPGQHPGVLNNSLIQVW